MNSDRASALVLPPGRPGERRPKPKERPLDDSMQQLVVDNRGLACLVAKHLFNSWPQVRQLGTIEDAMQQAMIGLIESANRYRPELGFRFSTYAATRIKKRLMNVSKSANLIRTPVYLFDGRGKSHKLRGHFDKAWSISHPVSLDDQIDQRPASPLQALVDEEEFTSLDRLLDSLDDRERAVIMRRFGLGGRLPETLREIGLNLGLSRERVRQIERDSLDKMRHAAGECVALEE